MQEVLQLSDSELQRYQALAKSPALCTIVELIGTACGFSGLGIMLAGRPVLGVICLLSWWLIIVGVFVLSMGGGVCIAAPGAMIWWALVVVSAGGAARTYNRDLAQRLHQPERR